MAANKALVTSILERMASFLVNSMLDFERNVAVLRKETVYIWLQKSKPIFTGWLDKAVIWDDIKREANLECFFHWLALLPYDATSNTEALLQCVNFLLRQRLEELEENQVNRAEI